MYVEDSLGDRVWVDLEPCKNLVDNICTLFQTRPHATPSVVSGKTEAVKSVGGDDVKSDAGGGGVEEVKGESLSSVDAEAKSRSVHLSSS